MTQQAEIDRRAFLTGHWKSKTGISTACLNHMGIYCQSCKDICDEDAIIFKPLQRGIQLPSIDSVRCTSCKECIDSCPADAITIADQRLSVHE